MAFNVRLHYDNSAGFNAPHLFVEYAGGIGSSDLFAPTGSDAWGPLYDVNVKRREFSFKFKEGTGFGGPWEGPALMREFHAMNDGSGGQPIGEFWCMAEKAFLYPEKPSGPEAQSAEDFLRTLSFKQGAYISGSGGLSALGANLLTDGRVLFGFYHPNAGRVFVMGSFNDWQRPSHDQPNPAQFREMKRYRGYFNYPNLWFAIVDNAQVDGTYKFYVEGGVPRDDKNRLLQYVPDPYSRRLGDDFKHNHSVIVDPALFSWNDGSWKTPDIKDLVFYELSVYGFTENDPDIQPQNRGKFAGITERIRDGYFNSLGINCLSLMPLAEVPSMRGPGTMGYNPSLFMAIERDFGGPDDLRELVKAAHERGIAVILDVVFNHTDNEFNPLWQLVLEHPGEQKDRGEGGLYFDGKSAWGNRIDSTRPDVQNMLLDACKLWIKEYHVDGFRVDGTHTNWTDHGFLRRLANEIKGFKPDVVLVAENLPVQSDLNLQGWNGYAQWADPFHRKLKALLREGEWNGANNGIQGMADVFFFSNAIYAAHTNNVVNYTESHDETSVPWAVKSNPALNHQAAMERKGRLAMLATMTALGQPMLYQGQEFNVDRGKDWVSFDWPASLEQHGFFQWCRRVIRLRRRYPALRLSGFNPAQQGQFQWILGPWMDGAHGNGKRVLGWRSRPNFNANDAMVVLLNFENHAVTVDLELGIPGAWVKLADIDRVNDIAPEGNNSPGDAATLRSNDGRYARFVLPSSSGFIYKWESS